MKKIVLLLTACCALIGCKKNNVDFTYSPTEPRAGQSVLFSNQSSSGEDWEWTFGDGGTATLRSPSHTYRNPGSYLVTLKVDNKKSWMVSKQITVYDTIPTFVCEDSIFYIFRDYTFTANIYNPYNYDIAYLWTVNGKEAGTQSSLTTYFTEPNKEVKIDLTLTLNEETTLVEKSFLIEDRATNSLLIRTTESDYRQRIFGSRAEEAKVDASAKALLDAEQDSAQTYNGKDFSLSELKTSFPNLEGFHIANRKIYYRAGGLWVANIDGAYPVQIDTAACSAMTLDTRDNRIYWANAQGVWYMPFVGSDNNQFVSEPTQLNTLQNIIKLAADAEDK